MITFLKILFPKNDLFGSCNVMTELPERMMTQFMLLRYLQNLKIVWTTGVKC